MIAKMDPHTRERHEFVAQAILKQPPSFFARRGVSFQSGTDDLNAFQVAELVVDDIPFALMRHEGIPRDETEVYLPDNIPLNRIATVIGCILREFGLPATAIRWQRRRSDTPS
jgi:hypothetical protein